MLVRGLAEWSQSRDRVLANDRAPSPARRSVVPSRRALLGSRQTRRRRAWRQNTSYRPLFLVLISGQIKTGSLRRSERNGRYNRLMEIAIRAAPRSLASRG